MTATILEQETDWALFEEFLKNRPCYDCSETATWMQVINCCGFEAAKCDGHKKTAEQRVRVVELCRVVTWNCAECGANGKVTPGSEIWKLIKWVPL